MCMGNWSLMSHKIFYSMRVHEHPFQIELDGYNRSHILWILVVCTSFWWLRYFDRFQYFHFQPARYVARENCIKLKTFQRNNYIWILDGDRLPFVLLFCDSMVRKIKSIAMKTWPFHTVNLSVRELSSWTSNFLRFIRWPIGNYRCTHSYALYWIFLGHPRVFNVMKLRRSLISQSSERTHA